MKKQKDLNELFPSLFEWSKKPSSYFLHDFCKKSGIDEYETEYLARVSEANNDLFTKAKDNIFDRVYEGCKKIHCQKEKFIKALYQMAYKMPERVLEDLEYEVECEEFEQFVKDMERHKEEPEKALYASIRILDHHEYKNHKSKMDPQY